MTLTNPQAMLAKLAVAMIALLIAFGAGWTVKSWQVDAKAKADAEARLAKYQADVEEKDNARIDTEALLNLVWAEAADTEAKLHREIDNARRKPQSLAVVDCPSQNDQSSTAASGPPVQSIRFTREFVWLWDDAILGVSPARDPGALDAAAKTATDLGPGEILANHETQSSVCNGWKHLVEGWQAWACKNKLWKGPPCQ